MSTNPSTAPTASTPNASPLPPVLQWYSRYCAGAAALFGTALPVGILFIVKREEWSHAEGWLGDADLGPEGLLLFGVLWMLTMAFLAMLHVAARVTTQRAPWAWTLHAIVQGIGLTTLVLWPFAFPILFHWLKPETQRWYGRVPLQDRRKKRGEAEPSPEPEPAAPDPTP